MGNGKLAPDPVRRRRSWPRAGTDTSAMRAKPTISSESRRRVTMGPPSSGDVQLRFEAPGPAELGKSYRRRVLRRCDKTAANLRRRSPADVHGGVTTLSRG